MAAINWKLAGKVKDPWAREMVTCFLHRLAHDFQDPAAKFGELVQKQDPPVCQ